MTMKFARVLPPQLTVSICFALIGTAHVAALWLELYRLVTMSIGAAIVLACLSGAAKHRSAVSAGRALVTAAPIYLYVLLSALSSPEPATAVRDALYVCIAVTPAVAFGATLADRYNGSQVAHGFGILLLPFAAQALANAVAGNDLMLVGDESMRTVLGIAICLISPVLAGAWASTRRPIFLVFGLIAATLVVTMESRSVVLFALPASLLSLYVQDRSLVARLAKRWAVPLIVVIALASPTMLARFAADSTSLNIGESVIEDLQKPAEDRVDFERRLTTFTAAATFLDNPIFGRGYASIVQVNRDLYGVELSAHGLVPGTLSELGVVGMVIVLAVVWRVVRRARRARPAELTRYPMLIHFVVGLCTLMAIGLVHQVLESVFFGLALGYLVGMTPRGRISRQRTPKFVEGRKSSK